MSIPKASLIKVRCVHLANWNWIAPKGRLVTDQDRAETMTGNEAGRRILQYLNDYPGWEFKEVALDGPERKNNG